MATAQVVYKGALIYRYVVITKDDQKQTNHLKNNMIVHETISTCGTNTRLVARKQTLLRYEGQSNIYVAPKQFEIDSGK